MNFQLSLAEGTFLSCVDSSDLEPIYCMQEKSIRVIAQASSKPNLLVLMCGGLVDVSFSMNNPKIRGILWDGYPGEVGAVLLAEILFGEHNPG